MMSQRFILFSLFFLFFLSGCVETPTPPNDPSEGTKSSQEVLIYPQTLILTSSSITPKNIAQEDFTYRYYAPWFRTKMQSSIKDASWANQAYGIKKTYYGENLQLINDEEMDLLIKNTHFSMYNSAHQYAIMVENSYMRNLPTNKPFYKKTTLPGEGFPFDYLQTSRIHINEPIRISHYSKDGAWAFVESSFASGWLPIQSFLILESKERLKIIRDQKIAITQDNLALYDENKQFITHVKIGAIFPIEGENNESFRTYVYEKSPTLRPKKLFVNIQKSTAQRLPIAFEENTILALGNQFLGEKYGWGGYLDNRDCSAMTRDFLTPFGVWIPRNSAAQKNFGEFISLKNLNNKEKEEMILKHGIAFLSLIYLKGHIMLYAGEIDGKPLVMHNIWGLRTMEDGKEGRNLIGKAILSDLYIGNNQPNIPQEALLISRIEAILPQPSSATTKHNLIYKYPSIQAIEDNKVLFRDESSLMYDDKKSKTFDEKLENADIEDMFTQTYPAFEPITPPALNADPGRFRNDALLKKLYGSSKSEIEKNLTTVTWLPKHGAKKILFNKHENAAIQLQKVSDELDKLPKEYMKYLENIAGTYYYRTIAGTNRLSAHSYGIAIDLNVKYSRYWQWDKQYVFHNEIPKTIVDIFEKYGFVWGGRWYHYDTMHFEYRPELFESID